VFDLNLSSSPSLENDHSSTLSPLPLQIFLLYYNVEMLTNFLDIMPKSLKLYVFGNHQNGQNLNMSLKLHLGGDVYFHNVKKPFQQEF
jgi:hypothetical protein